MRRRDFLRCAAVTGGMFALPTGRGGTPPAWLPASESSPQAVGPLSPATFQGRLSRARGLMTELGFSALFCEPSTNFEYLTGTSFGRSERLIALVVPAAAEPFLVAPSFEVERVAGAVEWMPDVRGWDEAEDPYRLVADGLKGAGAGRLGIEPSVRYGVARQLGEVLGGWELADADLIFGRLRMVKSEEELRLIRRAIAITEAAIAATFAALEVGVSDGEVARYLRRQMAERGGGGGGLVQFGPTSAIPHGGTEERVLERGVPVLIDAGCRVHGYTSDVTRMHFFGDDMSPRYREIFNTVLAAQSAAFEAGRPGMACQQLDRIARNVIREAGYGRYFTHRLGHGMGMDGHEPPYLVEGNSRALEPGMVFTIEPGIYLPGRWGVRIEDDVVVRDHGLEAMSSRVSPI